MSRQLTLPKQTLDHINVSVELTSFLIIIIIIVLNKNHVNKV